MNRRFGAEKALRTIAMQNCMTVEQLRTHIKIAMLSGLTNPDPDTQARWKKIPCKGELPTPEELIVFLATNVDASIDPFE